MIKSFSFDDVLIVPNFSDIKSRKDVDISQIFIDQAFKLPVISSNMDSVTEGDMSRAMLANGAASCIHRFCSIADNIKLFNKSILVSDFDAAIEKKPWVSIGLGNNELERAEALYSVGAETFVIDVAHGATIEVVNQVNHLDAKLGGNINIIVGNFATSRSIKSFNGHLQNQKAVRAYKVGIGGGSACTTRLVTGCGVPTLSSIVDCVEAGYDIIADGGLRNSGDICKALASGAKMVMLGGMLAGCDESAGEGITRRESLKDGDLLNKITHKKYRGSASAESYAIQNKLAEWRSAEGESFLVPCTGPVKDVLQQIEGGLRSAMSYVGAATLREFKNKSEFTDITTNAFLESKPHGKSRS